MVGAIPSMCIVILRVTCWTSSTSSRWKSVEKTGSKGSIWVRNLMVLAQTSLLLISSSIALIQNEPTSINHIARLPVHFQLEIDAEWEMSEDRADIKTATHFEKNNGPEKVAIVFHPYVEYEYEFNE